MRTEFIEFQLPVTQAIAPAQVEAALLKWGQPLRWAIVKVTAGSCYIEAIVTIPAASDE
jgi:hypothetical protein